MAQTQNKVAAERAAGAAGAGPANQQAPRDWERREDSIISEALTPLFVVEELGEWLLEFYDDGSVRYVDLFEGITEWSYESC